MFGQPKPLASLSSGLLARKGQARPAMRPQGFGGFGSLASAGEDLGWNDMGPEPAPAPVVATGSFDPPAEAELPPVLVARAALSESITPAAADADVRPVSLATATRLQRETVRAAKKGKAAFTLRLDGERHLRLRLASATRHRSAQQLVTEALDHFLATLPEVEALASQLPARKR